MAGSFPRFRLWDETEVSFLYEFDCVTNINDKDDPSHFAEHESQRGTGSIIIPGSESAWDMNISFVLIGNDYEDLITKIDTLKTSVTKFTKFVLKIDKTPSTTEDYNVMRVNSFTFPLSGNKKRVNIERVECIFRVNSW